MARSSISAGAVRKLSHLLTIVLSLSVFAPEATAQEALSPYDLARARPGELPWAPLLRLRAAESRFGNDSTSQRATWLQLLASAEAMFGNHQRALAAWDRLRPQGGGDLEATRQRFSRARQVRILDTVLSMADTARVIMVNERHHAASDRILTLQLLRALRAKGFRYFAAEALAEIPSGSAPRYEMDNDSYTSEPVFAELLREARRLGYTLVPYEAVGQQFNEPDSLTPQQRRDYAQARNLARATVERDPQAKVLVHAGYDHIKQRATPQWSPMAAYFSQLTGIDPVTIDQTSGSERSAPAYAHPVHRALDGKLSAEGVSFVDSLGQVIGASAVLVDFVVIRAAGPLIDGRPDFLTMGGSRRATRIAVPECAARHCVLTAHRVDEPDSAAVLDRVEAENQAGTTLFLPETPVRLTLYAIDGSRLKQWTFRPPAR